MSEHGTCWRYAFFDRLEDETEDAGFCRRYPPQSTNDGENCLWPGVGFLDWCGEFRDAELGLI